MPDRNSNTAWDAWESIFAYRIRPGDGSDKYFFGDRDSRVCKFCDRGDDETSFSSDAHVIPAALGNRSLFSNEECDECNKLGSRLEDDLAKFLSLPRAISRLPARKGTAKLRHPNEQSFIKSDAQNNIVNFHLPSDDESIRFEDNGDGTIDVEVAIPSYRPINVAKALARMALFPMERNANGFEFLRSWVIGAAEWFPVDIYTLHIPGSGYRITMLKLDRYTRSGDELNVRVSLLYSSFLVTFAIPLDSPELPDDLNLLNFPPPYTEMLSENCSRILVTSNEREIAGKSNMTLSYNEPPVVTDKTVDGG